MSGMWYEWDGDLPVDAYEKKAEEEDTKRALNSFTVFCVIICLIIIFLFFEEERLEAEKSKQQTDSAIEVQMQEQR